MKSFESRITLIALLSVITMTFGMGVVLAADKPAAMFEGKDTLLRPQGYREWIFAGSSLGLRYDRDSEKASSNPERYHNVYIDRTAYREFSKTGKFPDGTLLILEIASAETKKEPGLQGSYQKEFVALEAAVKDRKRFPEGWAYFSFTDKAGKLKDKAQPHPKASCYACHLERADDDNVFTQFYPALRASRKR